MQTAVITSPRTVEICRTPLPEPGPGEVRVRLEGSGVCASNLPVWQGRAWFSYPLEPGAPGHEAWGVVDAAGPEVSDLRVGDRVALLSFHAYAEYDCAHQGSVVRLPPALDGVDFPGEPLACAVNVFTRSGIRPRERVAVVGVGFLGALFVALARHAGAEVVAVSRREFARAIAVRMGASAALPFASASQARDALHAGGYGDFDCVIEAVGSQEALDLASSLPRVRGRLVIAGYHQDGPRTVDMQSWNWRGIDVINAHERDSHVYVNGMRRALELVEEGALDPSPLFTHRVSLDRLSDAFELLDKRPDGFMKALVRV